MEQNNGGIINSFGVLSDSEIGARKSRDYYAESKRLRDEVLSIADGLKGNPLRFTINNEITMDVEITKSDLKTIAGKNTGDDKFNAVKNALARDIDGYLKKAKYVGWRNVEQGKHREAAYFVYYSRKLVARTFLALRRMNDGHHYKPYAILSEKQFVEKKLMIRKGKPP